MTLRSAVSTLAKGSPSPLLFQIGSGPLWGLSLELSQLVLASILRHIKKVVWNKNPRPSGGSPTGFVHPFRTNIIKIHSLLQHILVHVTCSWISHVVCCWILLNQIYPILVNIWKYLYYLRRKHGQRADWLIIIVRTPFLAPKIRLQ